MYEASQLNSDPEHLDYIYIMGEILHSQATFSSVNVKSNCNIIPAHLLNVVAAETHFIIMQTWK